ncbi:MAG TPA: ABC transporter substrate-binding protein [Bacteroidales bacterium]|nr:ABC transporter substrate-binding protein [Bacteroidales bacterium]
MISNYLQLLVFFIILLASCSTGTKDGTITGTTNNDYSELFSLEEEKAYTRLVVYNPWQGARGRSFTYYITNDTSVIPGTTGKNQIIHRPVNKVICTSTTHIAMIDTLGKSDKITGVSGADFVYDKQISLKIRSKKIKDIGYQNGYNAELIYKMNPDVLFVYGVGAESVPVFTRLQEMGIPVVYVADYLEEHPLARAEWLKVFGAIMGEETRANKIYDEIRKSYNLTRKNIELSAVNLPSVMMGLPFKDKWFVSPGNSYIARLIRDAGGNYIWSSERSDFSIPMSLEAVSSRCAGADLWLNPGAANSVNDILAVDPRLGSLQPVKNGRIYNNNKRVNDAGGNDYWESGSVNPHILLKDIARVIDSTLFPDHTLVYYKKLNSYSNN